jgi:hypothetical protein
MNESLTPTREIVLGRGDRICTICGTTSMPQTHWITPPSVLRRRFTAERRPFGWMDTGSSDKGIDGHKAYRQGSAMHKSRATWMVSFSLYPGVNPLTSPRCFVPTSKFTVTSGPGLRSKEGADDALGTRPTFHHTNRLTSLH